MSHYSDCRYVMLSVIALRVFMLSVVKLSVIVLKYILLSVIMLNVNFLIEVFPECSSAKFHYEGH